jgi:hypothetical protein
MLGCGCNCNPIIAEMNAWGVDGCREHFDEIVAWLATVDQGTTEPMTDRQARRMVGIAIEQCQSLSSAAAIR